MHTHTKSVLVGLGLLTAAPVFALAESACTSLIGEDSVPVPTKIVQPGVAPDQVGQVVLIQFTITEEGKPTRIQSVDPRPDDPLLTARIIRALRSWEFSPALNEDGHPIAVTVRMPIKVGRLATT
jgi:TonB family protein